MLGKEPEDKHQLIIISAGCYKTGMHLTNAGRGNGEEFSVAPSCEVYNDQVVDMVDMFNPFSRR
jgi:hypothetical protein